ncbi:MAG: phage holin family protein [Chloroflexota bacterium]|nr:phage holin family protein [Chloroflexota bacterium]
MRSVLASGEMHERPGYRTLVGRIRDNVRTYIRKQLLLPRQEITEIIQANLRAVKWLAISLVLLFLFLVSFVILLVAIVAIWLPLPLAALIVTLVLLVAAALVALRGYKLLELHGPTRTIDSFKETITWAKARLLGRSES